MSAVEIMDPKMDGGYGLLEAKQLEEMVDAGAVLCRPTDQQAVEIMDQLLAAEFTWFSGYALPQTLYTCIYVHQPSLLHHEALDAYLKAVLKGCAVTCAAVNRADIREDEEFIPVIFTVDLCSEDSVESVLEGLEAAIRGVEADAKQPDADAAVLKSLLSRLQLRQHYFKVLSLLTVEDHSPVEHLKEVYDELAKCREQLVSIIADRSPQALGTSVNLPEGVFSDQCVRWVASPSPMLPIQLLSWEQTQAAALKYFTDLQWLCKVAKCQTLPQLLHFLQFYSERKPNVPARSFLWLNVYGCVDYRIMNRDVLQNFVLKSLELDYGAPVYFNMAHDTLPPIGEDGIPTAQHQQRDLIFRWSDKASSCIWLLMHALCSNRSRLRRKLANLFPELGAWQHQSWETDGMIFGNVEPTPELQEIHARCFVLTAYTYEIVLWVMSFYLLLGCELELYKQSELKAIYWYIDYLITLRFENFGTLHKVQDSEADKARDRPVKGKKKRPEPALHIAYTSRIKTRPSALVHVTLEAHYCLSRALVRFLDVLVRDGLHSETKAPLGSPALVFNNRLKPFLYLMRPQFVGYETFLLHADASAHATADLLGSALDLLKRCKLVLEGTVAVMQEEQHTAAMTALLKVTKANMVCLQLYQQGHAQGKDVELDWTACPQFPIIKFRKKAERAS
eukprot:GGOE01000531.1.p1 GENE.GGOE01000531.1~~GGOE01000531.1.p1  ORF type:complete len:730 (+),score=240.76 GGOE01000531.1:160-2190(+)